MVSLKVETSHPLNKVAASKSYKFIYFPSLGGEKDDYQDEGRQRVSTNFQYAKSAIFCFGKLKKLPFRTRTEENMKCRIRSLFCSLF
jgi:hypothetical protein